MSRLTMLFIAAMAAGCAHAGSDVGSGDEQDVKEQFPATHCELFVDRTHPVFDSHGVEALTLYLKTPLDRLQSRGGVKAVGFHAQEVADGKAGPFTDIFARPFADAKDYWEVGFSLASDFSPTTTFKGAFFVDAADGTRFWVNAAEGGRDFVLDTKMIGNLEKLRPAGFFASSSVGPPQSIVAVDEFPYLNPGSCR